MSKEKTTATDVPFEHATEEVAAQFRLDHHLVGMMLEEPFYAKIIRILSKIKTRQIPTAGVIAKDGDLKMYWNDRFMAALSGKHVRGVIKHECLHLIFEHTTTRKYEPHKIWNYATDLAINSHLMDELPEFGLFPGRPSKALTEEQKERMGEAAVKQYEAVSDKLESFPRGQAAEWYFARLMEDDEVKEAIENPAGQGGKSLADALRDGDVTIGENGQVCDADGNPIPTIPGTLDDHDGWGEMSEEDREYVKAKVKQAACDAAKECDSKGSWGNVPAELRRQIKAALVAEIPWQKIIDRFCGYSRRANRTTSYSRIHSTMGRLVPGAKRGYTSSVATYIDQSGSVDDQMLGKFFAALDKLSKLATFTVVPFDTEVCEDHVFEWKKGKRFKAERVRYGGTCFNAPTKWVNERQFDGHIVLTDLCAPKPVNSKCKRLWVTTEEHAQRPYFETKEIILVVD